MTTWIALLRGVNVGGHNKLPMAQLRAGLDEAGLSNPRTYIQSGNVIVDCDDTSPDSVADRIADVIERDHGFRPAVWVMDLAQLQGAVENNPFDAHAQADPKSVHYFFIASTPPPSALAELAELAKPSEAVELGEGVVYLHAPEGIGRSKLAERFDRVAGTQTTARNHRTVAAVLELAKT